MKPKLFLGLSILTFACSCTKTKEEQAIMKYPLTNKSNDKTEYFGSTIQDPYRWLEDDTAAATTSWLKAQNDVTFGYLNAIPFRADVKNRIEEVMNFERISAPFVEGNYIYYYKNDGLQNHSVLYRKKGEHGVPEVFLDPNTFSEDGTTGLAGIYFTKDGTLATYLITEGGADWRKAITIRTSDKQQIEDALIDLKFTGISWKGNEGFYYSSYEKPKGSELSSKTQHHKLLYHKLGTSQKDDALIFGGETTPRRYIWGTVTEDERFLEISAANSTTGNELHVIDLTTQKQQLVTLINNFDNEHSIIDNNGDKLIIKTNFKAPNYRIIETKSENTDPSQWKDLITETEQTIEGVSTAGKKMFVNYLKDASTAIKQFDYDGRLEHEVVLPGIGSADGFEGKAHDETIYYAFTSFTFPTTIYKYNLKSRQSTLYNQPKVHFNPEAFETKQVFFESKDGTKIPMFIVHKKGLELNGKNPTILFGYGGFNVSLTPSFSASRIVWLENGGVFAQPNLRGGGEYGEKWHLAGTKLQKQNVFDDFIAAAEYLKREGYTSTNYLALSGGSNGGLLVGATMTQQPDLAKVALPDVGVLDMLRYHTFTAGAGWAFDYGTAEDSKEMFEYLLKYSPVHAVKKGVRYPATMITTADHDDRVVPAHSFKFAATLQENHEGENPVLIRVEVNSGHGDSNLSKAIERIADQYSFAWYNMNVVPPVAKKGL